MRAVGYPAPRRADSLTAADCRSDRYTDGHAESNPARKPECQIAQGRSDGHPEPGPNRQPEAYAETHGPVQLLLVRLIHLRPFAANISRPRRLFALGTSTGHYGQSAERVKWAGGWELTGLGILSRQRIRYRVPVSPRRIHTPGQRVHSQPVADGLLQLLDLGGDELLNVQLSGRYLFDVHIASVSAFGTLKPTQMHLGVKP